MYGASKMTVDSLTIVSVFRTNVLKNWQAEMLCDVVNCKFPGVRCNFDLQDIDRIFRIESDPTVAKEVQQQFIDLGYMCDPLGD